MTRLARILAEQKTTYTSVAERARLQPRTVRQLATGETPIDNVAVGTVRRIASALALPVSVLLEDDAPHPGDRRARVRSGCRPRSEASPGLRRARRTSRRSKSDRVTRSRIVPPDEFLADMPPIDADRT